jgi:type II secretory pathway pseudopilin PulG
MWETIFKVLIAALGALLTGFIVPWIRSRTTASQRDASVAVIQTLVRAAEQVFNANGKGPDKKTWVREQIALLKLPLSEAEINAIIEAAVLEINRLEAA